MSLSAREINKVDVERTDTHEETKAKRFARHVEKSKSIRHKKELKEMLAK